MIPDQQTLAVRTAADLRKHMRGWRKSGLSVALIPTMGALHKGHLSLVDMAIAKADRVVVSIFVNPTQFAPHEDFDLYPRDEEADLAKLQAVKVHLAYLPSIHEMYPNGFTTRVTVSELTEGLCATARPHFFDGVTTVVAKLFAHCTPDMAIFGEKDYQQLLVIKRMVDDLSLPIEILAGPVVREDDGLAISSRNQYLSADDRTVAAMLSEVLRQTADAITGGHSIAEAVASGKRQLLDAGFGRVDYLELRNAEDLKPLHKLDRSARLLSAARLGNTRLIDNWPVLPSRQARETR